MIRRPQLVLQNEPAEDFALVLHLTDHTKAQSWSEHAPMNWAAYVEEAE
jgi:hypothetical protein